MKLLSLIALSLATGPALAHADASRGNFLICANEENTLKMTADLSEGKGEKVATAVQRGVKKIFPELVAGKSHYSFSFYPAKKTPLIVTELGHREPEIRLTLAPEQGAYEVLHDTRTPMIYKMSKFKALLSVKTFKVKDQAVTCTESKWENL